MKKKLQVFVSSTYLDLQTERQAAVQAILDAGHIPAGMELFRAGNESQLKTIKKWIDNSDVYMLILGGRYGSIDDKTGKSYTQIEYEYALEKKIPVFSVILSDEFLHIKASNRQDAFEKDNVEQYESFKKTVMSKTIKSVDDEKDITIAIYGALSELLNEYHLVGWVRGSKEDEVATLTKENMVLNKEITALTKEKLQLTKQLSTLQEKMNTVIINNKDSFGDYSYEELVDILAKKKIVLPANTFGNEDTISANALHVFIQLNSLLCTGVTNSYGSSEIVRYIYHNVAPYFMSYGLCEKLKVSGVAWERIQLSKMGLRFFGKLETNGYTAKKKVRKRKNGETC